MNITASQAGRRLAQEKWSNKPRMKVKPKPKRQASAKKKVNEKESARERDLKIWKKALAYRQKALDAIPPKPYSKTAPRKYDEAHYIEILRQYHHYYNSRPHLRATFESEVKGTKFEPILKRVKKYMEIADKIQSQMGKRN